MLWRPSGRLLTDPQRPIRLRDSVFAACLGVAVWFAIASFAAVDRDPQSSREGAYLALWAAAVVTFVALWGGRRVIWTALAAAGAVTTVTWAVGTGYLRGAVVGAVLTAAVVGLLWLIRNRDQLWLALSCGSQLVIRSDVALGSFDTTHWLAILVHWLLLPLVAGTCLQQLALHHGRTRTWIVALLGVILGPGFTFPIIGSLASLTGGTWLGRSASRHQLWGGGLLLALAVMSGLGVGSLLLLAGLALVLEGQIRWLVAAGSVALIGGHWGIVEPGSVLDNGLVVAALLPTLVLSTQPFGMLAALLIVAAASSFADSGFLAIGAMVGALNLRHTGSMTRLQLVWLSGCAGAVGLASAYPWLRVEPLAGFAERATPVLALLGSTSLVLVGGWLIDRVDRGQGSGDAAMRYASWFALCLVAFVVILRPVEVVERPLEERPAQVDFREHRDFRAAVMTDQPIESVVVDASLTNGVGLAKGATVARLRFLDADRREIAGADMRAGIEVADWSSKPDRTSFDRTLRPWMAFVAPGQSIRFGYRYRVDLEVPAGAEVAAVEVVARPALGPAQLVIYRMELRR